MKIKFLASFDEHKDKMKFKGDNSGRIWFDFDASQYPQMAKMGLMPTNKLLHVTVEFSEGKESE